MQISAWFHSSLHLYLCSACIEFILGLLAAIVAIVDFRKDRNARGFVDLTVAVGLFVASAFTFRGVYLDSVSNDSRDREIEQQSNDLSGVKSQLAQATNDLAVATNKINSLSSDMAAANIKPAKERLFDLLNSIDKRALPALQYGGVTNFQFSNLPSFQVDALRALAIDPELKRYIHLEIGGVTMMGGVGDLISGNLYIDPSILK
jgi:hypothetical protein